MKCLSYFCVNVIVVRLFFYFFECCFPRRHTEVVKHCRNLNNVEVEVDRRGAIEMSSPRP